ncbi:MAG: lipoate--protein ligase [Candidatus Heimdallarchaeaceae archaeon]
MIKKWRLLLLGEVPWIRTQSLYHSLALQQAEDKSQNTLIINWPDHPFICVGLHQIIELSVNRDFATKSKLPIVRRSCGGGTVYLDSKQLFYQLLCNIKDYPLNLGKFYESFLQPVIETYKHFDIPAEYSPINDIVANGRKISGNGAVTIEQTRILVGNFIFHFPSEEMAQILKIPDEKFRDKIAKSLQERMGSFEYFLEKPPKKEEVIKVYLENFEKILGVKLVQSKLTKEELEHIKSIEETYLDNKWLYYVEKENEEIFTQKIKSGTYFTFIDRKFDGGLVQVFLHFEKKKIADVVFSGDFTFSPPFLLPHLEKTLVGLDVEASVIQSHLKSFFDNNNVELPGISIDDITEVIIESYNKVKES